MKETVFNVNFLHKHTQRNYFNTEILIVFKSKSSNYHINLTQKELFI